MGGRKFLVTVGAVFLLTLMSFPAYAGTYLGEVDSPVDGNPYGITDGTDVRLFYDPALEGTFSVEFDTGWIPGDDPLLHAYFDHTDVDENFQILISYHANGQLTELNITTDNHDDVVGPYGTLHVPWQGSGFTSSPPLGSIEYTLSGDYEEGGEVVPYFITGTLSYTEVPIPGAIFLLGSGVACLVGLRRRFI